MCNSVGFSIVTELGSHHRVIVITRKQNTSQSQSISLQSLPKLLATANLPPGCTDLSALNVSCELVHTIPSLLVLLLSLSITPPRFIHVVSGIRTSSFYKTLSIHCANTPRSVYLSICWGMLGLFPIWLLWIMLIGTFEHSFCLDVTFQFSWVFV